MATRTRAPRVAAHPSRATANAGALRNAALARPFLPSLDRIEAGAERFKLLDAADKREVIETKIADVTHFRVGLGELRQLIGVQGNTIGVERAVPMAGTLGLGYVLNMAQVWKYDGLTLGNLLYSLPHAPGEQQHSSLREDSSAQATFDSAFEEHVAAQSSGKSSNSGNTRSSLDGARTYTSGTSEDMHRAVERQAAARRSAQRTAVRLATETDRESVSTKVVTNHNKAHALTVQYWEVPRQFSATTEIEGVNLVCFVPMDLVRFLPAGQQLALTDLTRVDTAPELLLRYSLVHRHSDAIQPNLPGRHREGLRILEDFAARSTSVRGLAAKSSRMRRPSR